MDPTLLQHPSSFDFPISSESKYLGHERPFPNPSYSTNDFSTRKYQGTLTNGASTSAVALPTNSSLDFSSSLLNDTQYHSNSHLLLSPPDSTTGSATVSGNPTTSSFVYATLPKPFPSNAGSADHFSNAPPSILSSNWTGSGMTVMDRPPRFPPPLSPPLSYSANGIPAAVPMNSRLVVDRMSHTYQPNGHTSISHGYLQQPTTRFPPGPYSSRNSVGHYSISDNTYSGHNMSTPFQENAGAGRQDGPPFGDTNALYPVLNVRNQHLVPEISASIQKGFFQVDRKWTCYRRNYFAVSSSFSFKNHGSEGPFYLHRNGHDEQIQQFSVSISAKTALTGNSESESRGLVQHTPKRDKATETVPGRHLISPTPPQTMTANGVYAGAGHIYGAQHHMSAAVMGSFGGFDNHNANAIPTTYTFERIQFQKATANNGKRRAQQQYFLLVVELSANVARTPGDENWVVIATKESEPMVVRGRSPGHYKDNGRRDSQTSMGPDRGSGHDGEGSSGSLPPPSYSHSMDWNMGSHRHGGHYGGSTYRQAMESDFSPVSMASSSTLAGTPTEGVYKFGDRRPTKSTCTLSTAQSPLTPLSEGSVDEDMMFPFGRPVMGRKRSYDDDTDEDHLRFHLPGPFTDSTSSVADYSATPYSKLLCASS